MRRTPLLALVAVIAVGLWVAVGAHGADPCTTTVGTATTASSAASSAPAGATICLSSGSYGTITLAGTRSGIATLQPAPGASPVLSRVNITKPYWRVQDLEIRPSEFGVVMSAGVHHIELLHDYLNAGAYQIEFDSQNPSAPGSPRTGSATAPITDVLVQGNRFRGATEDAIRVQNFRRVRFYENELTGIVESGSHVDGLQNIDGGDELDVRRNYWHDNAAQNFFIKDGEVSNLSLVDNLLVRNTKPPSYPNCLNTISISDVQTATIQRNTEWASSCGGGAYLAHDSGNQSTAVKVDHNVIDRFNVDGDQRVSAMTEASNTYGVAPYSFTMSSSSSVGSPSFMAPASDDYRISGSDRGVTWRPADYIYGPRAGSTPTPTTTSTPTATSTTTATPTATATASPYHPDCEPTCDQQVSKLEDQISRIRAITGE